MFSRISIFHESQWPGQARGLIFNGFASKKSPILKDKKDVIGAKMIS